MKFDKTPTYISEYVKVFMKPYLSLNSKKASSFLPREEIANFEIKEQLEKIATVLIFLLIIIIFFIRFNTLLSHVCPCTPHKKIHDLFTRMCLHINCVHGMLEIMLEWRWSVSQELQNLVLKKQLKIPPGDWMDLQKSQIWMEMKFCTKTTEFVIGKSKQLFRGVNLFQYSFTVTQSDNEAHLWK